MSIEEKRDQLVEELTPFEDPFERFASRYRPGKRPRTSLRRVQDRHFPDQGLHLATLGLSFHRRWECYFKADSDASITKGTAGLLCELYSGETPENIIALEPDFLAEVGITQHLSPTVATD